mgnify:CR=1 FL=1
MGTTIKDIINSIIKNTINVKGYNDIQYMMITFSIFVIILVITMFMGKLLWNKYLTEVIPAIKKVDSVFQIAAIFLLVQLMIQ